MRKPIPFRDALSGATAALLLPRHMSRIPLLAALDASPPAIPKARDPEAAIRSALFALQLLSRLRTSLWKNTCFYRSVLQSTLLRRAGREAVLRIGTAKTPDGSVIAHAWVEIEGMPTLNDGIEYTQLLPARTRSPSSRRKQGPGRPD